MQIFKEKKATIKMISIDFYSMELLMKSEKFCIVFDFKLFKLHFF